jgi:hypothetical protein
MQQFPHRKKLQAEMVVSEALSPRKRKTFATLAQTTLPANARVTPSV